MARGHHRPAHCLGRRQSGAAAGKSIQVSTGSLRDAQRVALQIKPEGAWFSIWNSYPRDEVKGFLDWLERWAAGKEG